ncbi:MAG: hypothetical protein IR153_05550 [Flavobacterium sp.]|nr:hypothetical protein [Flavobacterium sp.]
MKFNFFKTIFAAALFSGVVAGCVTSDDYDVPASVGECVEPALVANKTVAEINTVATGSAVEYTSPTTDVIEAYVTSNDERGNFFKTVSLQTLAPAGQAPIGFSVAIDETSLFGKGFKPGRKVYVVMNGLTFARVDGSLKIGAPFNGSVGRLAEADYVGKVVPSCQEVEESMLVRQMTLSQAKNNANLNTLIELTNVQFKDNEIGEALYSSDNDLGGATNRIIVDANGNELIFRTSSFANFSGMTIPGNSGTIRGVMTKFGSDWQFMARAANDIQLTNPRLTAGNPGDGGGDVDEPTPGAPFVFPGGDFENYSAFTASINNFGIMSYANQSAGTGRDNSNSLHISTTGAAGNDYVFTTFAHAGLPATYSKIQFYMRGTSAKSVSLNVYKNDGSYYRFNLGNVSSSTTISAAENNQYSGTINTNGNWVLVTLDLTGITDLNTTNFGGNFFALKIGSASAYDLHFDNFTIE